MNPATLALMLLMSLHPAETKQPVAPGLILTAAAHSGPAQMLAVTERPIVMLHAAFRIPVPEPPQTTTQPSSSTHYMTITWTAPADQPNPPASGNGYNLWRAAVTCPASGLPTGAAQLNSTPLTATTVYDTTAAVGTPYCYYVISQLNGALSAASNTSGATISPFAPSGLTVTPH